MLSYGEMSTTLRFARHDRKVSFKFQVIENYELGEVADGSWSMQSQFDDVMLTIINKNYRFCFKIDKKQYICRL